MMNDALDLSSQQEICAAASSVVVRAARATQKYFPHHSNAILGQIVGCRATLDRWNRVLSALSALMAIPGEAMNQEEKNARNTMMAFRNLAMQMSKLLWGARDPKRDMAHISDKIHELNARLATFEMNYPQSQKETEE